jgi:hypothetical protein
LNIRDLINQSLYFLTYNDQPSGIYKSQVIDVINYLSKLSGKNIKLISFVPWQTYIESRKKIHFWYANSIVIPIFPGISFWKIQHLVFWIINFYSNSSKIIARGPIACYLALKSKRKNQKIVFDARGAIKAEIEEFRYFTGKLAEKVIEMEKKAVLEADFRIAVSNALVDWWKKEYHYDSVNYVVIPCTASDNFVDDEINEHFLQTDKVVLVYAGSTSPWQSFPLLLNKVEKWLSQTNGKVLFLSKETKELNLLMKSYPNRVLQKFVPENQVHTFLCACDYGLLIREKNQTNQVSSPVKFAEYLRAGLKIIISDNIGDYTSFTKENNIGYCIDDLFEIPTSLTKLTEKDRVDNLLIFNNKLSQECFSEEYQTVLAFN